MKIKNETKGAGTIAISELIEMQGDLKELNPISYDKFKRNLMQNNFSEPVSVWKDGSRFFILNGHQRIRTLLKMKEEGIEIPAEIPINYTEAKTKKEAMRKLAVMASEYGMLDGAGLIAFLDDTAMDIGDVLSILESNTTNIEKLMNNKKEEVEGVDADYGRTWILNLIFEKQEDVEKMCAIFGQRGRIIDGSKLAIILKAGEKCKKKK
jgi:hypothetical protein